MCRVVELGAVSQMSTSPIILRALLFGVLAETIAIGLSFGLGSLSYRREPMADPFTWTATVLQMPGVFASDTLAQTTGNYAAWFSWSVTFCIQSLLWSIIGFAFLLWRDRKSVV